MVLGGMAALAAPAGGRVAGAPGRTRPLVLAHRGCSALRPEHSAGAYAKAIADGADYIEPDIVITADGVLVARHENDIASTTDVASRPEFARRRTTKRIDGHSVTGWFTEDFTLAELKTLRTIERLGDLRPESRGYDGQFPILTLDEVIELAATEGAAHGRVVGLVPEIKHSTYFAGIGLPIEDRLLATLAAHEQSRRHPVEIQSFEIGNLRSLRERIGRGSNIRLMQLLGERDETPADIAAAGGSLTYGEMATPAGLRAIAAYADTVSPSSRMLIPLDAEGRLGEPSSLVRDAHEAGLLVGAYTFRPENRFLPLELRDGAGNDARNEAGSIAEIRRYLALGVDRFFTDDPALGRIAVDGS
ncbi:glycerophosphoryl diester phosphodiesterase [Sphingobium sp. SYK-6]|uniref:glycerophosphodiester phosphodiesterase n=1 Tax=Sphingobium sp. (strain NBRC 103272 / SYK-6) TaxID=627192 RepID=UPI0002277302|nr:glycerophosphodiester phosphodiesterase [Sphingobium sp. SYK-6]BAK67641.1 glycerophosphoryl diester phosphodiesterase [Sphingobium sp. SYK-6]